VKWFAFARADGERSIERPDRNILVAYESRSGEGLGPGTVAATGRGREMSELPDDVERIIADHFDSIERLEIVLLLRNRRARDFAPAEVTAELRLGPASAPEQLAELARRGFAVEGGEPARYRYAPDTPEKERLMNELARCYAERRVTVISQIFAPRSDPVRSFADAFKLRRK
jgi:hypothetical protein